MEKINFVVENTSKSPMAVTYRFIRTNLQFIGARQDIEIYLLYFQCARRGEIYHCVPHGHVTGREKVLLVDCDLRKPIQHKVFGVISQGVANCLAPRIPFAQVVYPNVSPNLDFLTSGPVPPNPVKLIASEKIEQLLPQARRNYDYVLIDLPPVLAVTDAAILGNLADGVARPSTGKNDLPGYQSGAVYPCRSVR